MHCRPEQQTQTGLLTYHGSCWESDPPGDQIRNIRRQKRSMEHSHCYQDSSLPPKTHRRRPPGRPTATVSKQICTSNNTPQHTSSTPTSRRSAAGQTCVGSEGRTCSTIGGCLWWPLPRLGAITEDFQTTDWKQRRKCFHTETEGLFLTTRRSGSAATKTGAAAENRRSFQQQHNAAASPSGVSPHFRVRHHLYHSVYTLLVALPAPPGRQSGTSSASSSSGGLSLGGAVKMTDSTLWIFYIALRSYICRLYLAQCLHKKCKNKVVV